MTIKEVEARTGLARANIRYYLGPEGQLDAGGGLYFGRTAVLRAGDVGGERDISVPERRAAGTSGGARFMYGEAQSRVIFSARRV